MMAITSLILLYKIKKSPGKQTYPGPKQIHRFLENNLLKTDLVTLEDENISEGNSIPLLRKVVDRGQILEESPLSFEAIALEASFEAIKYTSFKIQRFVFCSRKVSRRI
jgi:hypothetical protein